ncbi:MAG: NAD(P)/FAD-dependent oxidoreductase [Bacteroidota bacterium]|nr:NAD(P)/FAD-dependent oxidoreductase [Bacteroidota bacterium]MEC7548439.1 NAD(P)/FAD-dependent oxidoreductase [Bacteroidota bacterium]MEC7829858.1 NAD(P)/FAD-dependent oxidoreductase [Bacteroidota bacterium]MEC9160385.1 NAD(P)/FAD-dependent oxidoreductase [Bacteroidota bacterium]
MIKTDIIIIGAGPVGLFTVFEAGLMKLKCHVIDSIAQPGGQLTEIYPKKPIYDIPGYPSVLAGDLIDKLIEQASPFKPGFTLGERAEKIEKIKDGFLITTNNGTTHNAPVVIIAGGLGSFEPRKPKIDNIENFERKGIHYIIKDPSKYKTKNIVISGGGDSALDWSLYFAEKNIFVDLVHRSDRFRAHKDSVKKAFEFEKDGKMKIHTFSEVVGVNGNKNLETVLIKSNNKLKEIKTEFWFPLFGLSPKLGPISNWGLKIEKNAIIVNTFDYSTNIKGIFAIGDVNTYPGKLKLILCGFHEAALAIQSAYKIINPDKRYNMKYTTVQGIQGF